MGFLDFFKKNNSEKENSNSIKNIDSKYEESWNYNFLDLLKNGETELLEKLRKTYAPLMAVNDDKNVLLLFRFFQVQEWENERNVLNCHPDNDNFQCGITIVKLLEDGAASMSNVYLPNKNSYKELRINNDKVEIVTNDYSVVTTNVSELSQKLWLKFKENEIEEGYNNLCNEVIEKQKNKVKNKTIQLPSFNELTYNDDFEWYEGEITWNNRNIEISIPFCSPKKLEKITAYANDFLTGNFIENILLETAEKMTELKNDNWLEIDEATGKEEKEISSEEFKNRIYVEGITFNNDGSATIYCNDDDIFWGHSIEINVDKKGNYSDSNIAG